MCAPIFNESKCEAALMLPENLKTSLETLFLQALSQSWMHSPGNRSTYQGFVKMQCFLDTNLSVLFSQNYS